MATRKTKRKASLKKKKEDKLHLALVKQMLQLSTAGFGLVAALAWNDLIKELIANYVKPYTEKGGAVTSQIIYALIVTSLAVFVTYYLTKLKGSFEKGKEEASEE
jgi:hypothetical protein